MHVFQNASKPLPIGLLARWALLLLTLALPTARADDVPQEIVTMLVDADLQHLRTWKMLAPRCTLEDVLRVRAPNVITVTQLERQPWMAMFHMFLLSGECTPEFVGHFSTGHRHADVARHHVERLSEDELWLLSVDLKMAHLGQPSASRLHGLADLWQQQLQLDPGKAAASTDGQATALRAVTAGLIVDVNAVLLNWHRLGAAVCTLALQTLLASKTDAQVACWAASNVRVSNVQLAPSLNVLANAWFEPPDALRLQHLQLLGRALDNRNVSTSATLVAFVEDSALVLPGPSDAPLFLSRDLLMMSSACMHCVAPDLVADLFNRLNDPDVTLGDPEDLVAAVFLENFWSDDNDPRAAEALSALTTYSLRDFYLPIRGFRLRTMSVDRLVDFLQSGDFEPVTDLNFIGSIRLAALVHHPEFYTLPGPMQDLIINAAALQPDQVIQGIIGDEPIPSLDREKALSHPVLDSSSLRALPASPNAAYPSLNASLPFFEHQDPHLRSSLPSSTLTPLSTSLFAPLLFYLFL